MRNSSNNTDGIFMRRRNQQSQRQSTLNGMGVPTKFLKEPTNLPRPSAPTLRRPDAGQQHPLMPTTDAQKKAQKIDLDLTLDDEKGKQKPKGWRRFIKRPTKKTIKRALIVLGILIVLFIGYFAYKLFVASGNIFRGGGESLLLGDGIDKSKLQREGDGRINVLLAATSEDDPNHPGGTLTDSIMVASIDPVNKNTTIVSVPRDFWVKMPGCDLFNQEKINAANHCGEESSFKESGYPEGGMGLLQKVIENTFDININYYSKINYTAFRQAVDAVGGIDITIESPDPRGILDRNFDWICNYKCYKVKHPNGPVHLNGELALYLARSRNSAGGYGLPRGDFDRTEYQRKMMVALKDKATSVSTLSNPVKLSALIDSIGNNLVTNFKQEEIIKLFNLSKDIKNDKIKSIGLADEENPLLTTGNIGGASVVHPTEGQFAYTALRKFLRQQMIDPYIVNEAPTIALYNGTATEGLATEQKEILESYGYKVILVESAPTTNYTKNAFYDNTKGKKQVTKQYLQNRFNTKATTDTLPEGITALDPSDPEGKKVADFVIIIGEQ